jgi:CRP/FNR family transcriptional regulator
MESSHSLLPTETCLLCKLRRAGFFCTLPQPALEALDKIKMTSVFPKGTVIFVEGETPRGIYILCQGQAKLSMAAIDGKTLIVRVAEPGDVLGLHVVITGEPHPLAVETLQPCQLNFVKRSDFVSFLHQYGDACLHTVQKLSNENESALDLIRSVALSHNVLERLAKFLLRWSTQGQHTNGAIRVDLKMTREEIAESVGASRETVTRLLMRLRNSHTAEVSGHTLLIHDKSALERFVASF